MRPSRFLSGSWIDLNIDALVFMVGNDEMMRQQSPPAGRPNYKPDMTGGSRYSGRLTYPNMRAFKNAIGMPNLRGA